MPTSDPPRFPQLPIVQLDPLERKPPPVDKYGSFRYASIAGLVAFASIVGWFAWSAWSMREVWARVYTLHDATVPEAARIAAARALARDPRVTQRQLYDISLSRDIPAPARVAVASALTSEAMRSDPRGYALAVARSEGWPDWLRLLLLRPLAHGAGEGQAINQAALRELSQHNDPYIHLWAEYTLAESNPDDPVPPAALSQAWARGDGRSPLARLLLDALNAKDEARPEILQAADEWTRRNHPGLKELVF